MGLFDFLKRSRKETKSQEPQHRSPSAGHVQEPRIISTTRPTCVACGRLLSNEDVPGDTMFLDILAIKGFICPKCGNRYCAKCAPRAAGGTMTCGCGAHLSVPL